MAQSLFRSLNIGNIVTTGYQLYKNRFQTYFLLALNAYLWLLVPIYGWAKFWTISALISRLVYGELINQPETIENGKKYVDSRLWRFLFTALLLNFIAIGVWIVLLIALIIVFAIIFTVIALAFDGSVSSLQPGGITNTVISAIAIIISIIGLMFFSLRFFIVELPLAIEDNIKATSAIRRSWQLTKDFGSFILLIYFVTFLITLPLLAFTGSIYYLIVRDSLGSYLIAYPLSALIVLIAIVDKVYQFLFGGTINQNQILNLIINILSLCLSILSGAMQLPFWQAVKAVVYYDLRTRKEGLGLKLRDRNI
jgi:hypothetical protein